MIPNLLSATLLHDAIQKHAPVFELRTLIISWVKDLNPTCFVLWLYGPVERASLLSCSPLRKSVVRWKAGLEGVSFLDEINATFFFQQSPTNLR
jgi:hypothetical protein